MNDEKDNKVVRFRNQQQKSVAEIVSSLQERTDDIEQLVVFVSWKDADVQVFWNAHMQLRDLTYAAHCVSADVAKVIDSIPPPVKS